MDGNGLFLFGLMLPGLIFGVGFVTEVVEVVVVAELWISLAFGEKIVDWN